MCSTLQKFGVGFGGEEGRRGIEHSQNMIVLAS